MEHVKTNTFKFENGERYCHVIYSKTGFPLDDPNLYIMTNIRKDSVSINTIEAVAGSLALLYRFFHMRKIDIVERITRQEFLKTYEISALADFASSNLKNRKKPSGSRWVKESTKYSRLTSISRYLGWLYRYHLANSVGVNLNAKIMRQVAELKNKRPHSDRYRDYIPEKSLTESQRAILFDVVKPGSALNPFSPLVQTRNRLIISLLFSLGIRSGELLNLRISDIDFSSDSIAIRRRANDKSDPRVKQPLVKTCEREFILDKKLMSELYNYINTDRSKIKNAGRNDFLFITHKKGNTQGKPLSMSAYQKIINTISQCSPELSGVTGHQLRHTWNDYFSAILDKKHFSAELEEQCRGYLMGWVIGSEMAKIYNKRHIISAVNEISLDIQKEIMRGCYE
ncbi:site-specific integrase [Pectobacterium polaris]|uniref:tyrosine-type recombinase/integrase n=1 Tax=Pectobacterium polaris TaxID=2042057 RepID=UPI000D61CAD8|nr:site-specific integrase [Pectobacterium polaris]MCU1788581.1 site-specific integrase [Pectobacterium polaris]PWD57967.1 integrase [Pectobacterium polaris]